MIAMVLGGISGGLIFTLLSFWADYNYFIITFALIVGAIGFGIGFMIEENEFLFAICGVIIAAIFGALISNIPFAASIGVGVIIGGMIGIMLVEGYKDESIASKFKLRNVIILTKAIADTSITDKSDVEAALNDLNCLSHGVIKMLAYETSILNKMLAKIERLEILNKAKLIKEKCESNTENSNKIILLTPKYESFDLQEKIWNVLSDTSFKIQKLENDTIGAKEEKIDKLRIIAQENIADLERVEKKIREQIIDYEVVAGEYRYGLKSLLSEMQETFNNYKDEISETEKNKWEKQLDNILKRSDSEYEELTLVPSYQKFKKYADLIKEQKTICDKIEQNLSDFNNLNSMAKAG